MWITFDLLFFSLICQFYLLRLSEEIIRLPDKAEGFSYPFVCSKKLRIDIVFKDRVWNELMLLQIYYFSVITFVNDLKSISTL